MAMESLSTVVLAAIGGLIAIFLLAFRKASKTAGAKQAKQEAAAEIAAVKEEAINAKADQIQSLPYVAKYDAVLQQFLRRQLGKENSGRAKP
jgi:C4-dicarboxylate-specific signal transduction histidine kinase